MEGWTEQEGLSENEVERLHRQYGPNTIRLNERKRVLRIIADILKEPMALLLMAACVLYFILGEFTEGMMTAVAFCFVVAISVFQEIKSSTALASLQQLTEPLVKVIRAGKEKNIPSEELVPGDIVQLEEGAKVPADALVLHENDLSVNEAIVTGESLPVEKNSSEGNNILFQGTVINRGRCRARITAIGNDTFLGKIGKSVVTYSESRTRLQQQIDAFVKRFALFGIIAFLIIFLINYWHSRDLSASLLFGLALAMSAIPEEIPVAFSSFMALGAYHMSRRGIISRQPQTIENLGAVTVLCLDKTGTITENEMKVDSIYDFSPARLYRAGEEKEPGDVLYYALLASESTPFDPMEKAIAAAYEAAGGEPPDLVMTGEYPLHGHPPMMTHVYARNDASLVAAKGGVERLIRICHMEENDAARILEQARALASRGQRVLGVAHATHEGPLPENQDQFSWIFSGLLSLYDPPKPFVRSVFKEFYEAGISLKLLTGDYPETALSISEETGLQHTHGYRTGDEVMKADPQALQAMAEETSVFARMYPEAKLKVIQSLKTAGHTVCMTGDGVNDAPALKQADIGIAMGRRGTEVARQSADLILTNDDLRTLAEAIRQGRKIFNNLKKAVRYIVSIHIPIVLTAALPVLLGWKYPNIFTPIHVIFLELIMGPTCSIFFEREPVEEYLMKRPPVQREIWFFSRSEFMVSLWQGSIMAAAVLLLDYSYSQQGHTLPAVRTVVFTTLILCNILLTFVNRSFEETIYHTLGYRNGLVLPVLILSFGFLAVIHLVPVIRQLFGMTRISLQELGICFLTAAVSVGWIEIFKLFRRNHMRLSPTDHKHAF